MSRVFFIQERDLQNDKTENGPTAFRSAQIHNLPSLSKMQWKVCPEQSEHVIMESCFYLRKDGSECKHFMFFKGEHSSVCAFTAKWSTGTDDARRRSPDILKTCLFLTCVSLQTSPHPHTTFALHHAHQWFTSPSPQKTPPLNPTSSHQLLDLGKVLPQLGSL